MDSDWGFGVPNHRKRKRRRGLDRPPIAAQLVLDARLKGDVGVISEDLYLDLFPSAAAPLGSLDSATEHVVLYVAITPKVASSPPRPETSLWTILPVKKSTADSSKQLATSTIHFSSKSTALQSFALTLQKTSPTRTVPTQQSTFDIHVLDVVPLCLDTVTVSIDDVALASLEKANRDFHHGQGAGRYGASKSGNQTRRLQGSAVSPSKPGDLAHWVPTIREALSTQRIVHMEDGLNLPVPAHPITHVSAPPAIVEFCKPVSQGLLSPRTRIVVVSSGTRGKRLIPPIPASKFSVPNGTVEEEDDTSNEQFYSAAEDRMESPPPVKAHATSRIVPEEGTDHETSTDDESDLSDGETDTIGLSLPMLPSQSSGALSSFSSATPRPGAMYSNGIATPGSVMTTYTTSTIRGGSSQGRLFEAQGLLSRIPDEALHPKPRSDEDDEARVFVDTSALVKIGCFSGDWVRVETAPDTGFGSFGSLKLGGLNSQKDDLGESRVAKIYGLAGLSSRRARYAIDRTGNRRSSLSMSSFERAPLKIYLSPLFLANLGNPSNVRVASLAPGQGRASVRSPLSQNHITSSSSPPPAKEVTVLKYITPLATEKSLQSSLHVSLGNYFETRQRAVKTGDLIAVPIDDNLGRAIYTGAVGEEKKEQEEMLSESTRSHEPGADSRKSEVAWFKIGSVTPDTNPAHDDPDENHVWGGTVVVRTSHTRMAQSGNEHGKLPDPKRNPWEYYLGSKRLPRNNDEALNYKESFADPPRTFISHTRRKLRELVSTGTSPQAIHLSLPPVAILLTSTQRQVGKATVARNACNDLGLHAFVIDCYELLGEGGSDTKMELLLKARADRGLTCGPEYTPLLIQHVEMLTANKVVDALEEIVASSRVLIATTTDVEKIPEGVRSLFTHEIEISAPDEGEREGLLRDITQDVGVQLAADVDLNSIALKTAALVAGDLVDVVDRAIIARGERLEELAKAAPSVEGSNSSRATVRDVQIAGGEGSRCLTKADFDVAVEAARKNFADSIGAPKIPNVTWDDVGGLTNVKDAVLETIQLPLERPELFAKGMKKRSGILFYGPPGTGKTLLAKAIATEFSLNFFSVKGPELLNMYIGESEANVRRVFQRARDARPCVVFFDELDSVAPKRGNQGDSGGVMDRIVSQLLAELDGMSTGDDGAGAGGVFVIGATNRPDLLDPALLRPGRFDKMLYLGVSDTHDKQLTILEALTRKFALHPSLSLSKVASTLPLSYTGADLYALCSDAMLKAITRRADSVDAKIKTVNARRALPISTAFFFDHLATDEDTEVVVEEADFDAAGKELVPSVSAKELEHYERVKQAFEQAEEKKSAGVDRPRVKSPVRSTQNSTENSAKDDSDFVLRTERLRIDDHDDGEANLYGRMNGSAHMLGKGKGKAKLRDILNDDKNYGFGSSTEDDADMYST